MCGGRPCFTSVCGLSLQKTVLIIGFVQLGITIIATILNVVKMSRGYDEDECDGKDICIGAIIKFAVLDALFGVACGLMLIFGAKLKNHCLLILWMIVTGFASVKYIWIVCTRDWTRLEDWISISYLLFYLAVFLVIFSLLKEVKTTRTQGYVHGPGVPANTNTTVVINQQIPLQAPPMQPPGYYPPTNQPPNYPPNQPPHQPPYQPPYQPPNQPPNQPPPYTQQAPYNTAY